MEQQLRSGWLRTRRFSEWLIAMKGIIDNIITFYEMRAEALGVLVANTQKAIEELAPDRERMDSEQEKKLNNFVKDLTGDVTNMLTRFWFQKERKLRNNEQMTDEEMKNLADFANFVKTLTEDLRSLLTHFQSAPGRMVGEEFDKEIGQMEIYVKKRLEEFDKVLNGTNKTLRSRLGESVGNVISRIGVLSRERLFSGALNINVADSNSENRNTKYI
ncbi:MAG: hypothetical protein NTX52_02020 [Planctomycetota bacterium]|nr:hypothetical protein [Planctomycetota bacterium]